MWDWCGNVYMVYIQYNVYSTTLWCRALSQSQCVSVTRDSLHMQNDDHPQEQRELFVVESLTDKSIFVCEDHTGE